MLLHNVGGVVTLHLQRSIGAAQISIELATADLRTYGPAKGPGLD